MKKSVFLVCWILLSIVLCPAREISREDAAKRAAAFFRAATPAVRSVAATPRLVKEYESLYVFENDGEGYVVLAADDVAVPVLGYSLSGRFPVDDIPDNMRSMFEWYDRIISYARRQGWEPASVATESDTEVRLKTVRWGQWSPFNDLCPTVDGKKCPSGCVATAIAIIMKYYDYPESGTGILPAYDYGWDSDAGAYKYHMDGYALGHTYDWAGMPDGKSGFTDYQAKQIAQLLLDIGVMCQMNYAPDGSGAGSTSPLKLTQYFGYDKSMRFEDRSFYLNDQWEQLIRDEIDAGRPVFHCGFNPNGGHAFVMDGYRGRYFSINYGWSRGSSWYLLTPIEGHEEELTAYYEWQDMVVGICPDAGGAPSVNVMVPDSFLPFRWNFEEKTIWGGWFWMWDYSYTPGESDFAYGLFDRNRKFKQTVSEVVKLNMERDYLPRMTITLPDRIEDGDCILLARKDGEDWMPLPQSRQSYIRFDRSLTLSQRVSAGHSFGPPDSYVVGDQPRVFFDMYKDLWWTLSRESDGKELFNSAMEVEVRDDATVTATMLDAEASLARFQFILPAGTYRMTLRNFEETISFTFQL